LHSLPGLSQLLSRLKIHWKRARQHVHSPDPDYVAKLREVRFQVQRVQRSDEPRVLIFEDEFTLYRQPSLAHAYEQAGAVQPLAELGYKSNYTWRIAAGLNAWSGQVVYEQARYMDVAHLTRFYEKLSQAYPDQEVVVVEDNWSVHSHADLLAALQPQVFPYGLHRPPNWKSKARRRILQLNLPIRLVFLPIYASWTNPIEKLWRLLKQEVLHLHRYGDDWPGLKLRVWDFLDQFRQGSTDLLRYVGLREPNHLYQALFPAE
jgi:transposase